jgi:hypothetical protein
MTAVCGWVALAMLAAMLLLAAQRLARREIGGGGLLPFIPPVLACLIAAFVSLHQRDILAGLMLVVALLYVIQVLKPFGVQR